jgi:hypothetical protein
VPEIEGVIIAHVLADPTVAGIFAARVEPDPLGQGRILPALTYKIVGKPHAIDARTSWVRLQITVWGDTYAQVQSGSTAVRKALQGWAGISSGVTIIQATYLNQLDLPDPVTSKRTRPMDFQVLYQEV